MNITTDTPALMTREETARYLNICKTCLDRSPIPRVKIARSVRYVKADVDAWLEAQKVSAPRKECKA